MCLLGPLNVFPFHKQNRYLYTSTKALWGLLIDEICSPNSETPFQNGCLKTHEQNFNQSVIIKITQQNSKWPTKNS